MAAFGMQLRECRQAAGLSLRQLAGRVGYDHSYLSQVERGQRPGSADLARLCDRELETGSRLSNSFEQKPIKPDAASMRPTDPLESAWRGIVTAFGQPDMQAELGDFREVPPAELLVELATELQLLQAKPAVEVAQLTVLTALTLTGLGEPRAARRWWQAARSAADASAESAVQSGVRALEAISGLSERRPLEQLLVTADDALTLSTRACVLQAHATRALVLAELGRHAESHEALQQLIGVAAELPSASKAYSPLGDWTAYEVHGVEGRVCARLGYGAAGCVLLARALELCPPEWLGERARLEMWLAEGLAVDGDAAAAVALALRVLVELPDEWHSYYLYDDAHRVLRAARERQPGLVSLRDLDVLLRRRVYATGRSVGSGSSGVDRRG